MTDQAVWRMQVGGDKKRRPGPRGPDLRFSYVAILGIINDSLLDFNLLNGVLLLGNLKFRNIDGKHAVID